MSDIGETIVNAITYPGGGIDNKLVEGMVGVAILGLTATIGLIGYKVCTDEKAAEGVAKVAGTVMGKKKK